VERPIIWDQEQTWWLYDTQMQVEVILASQGPEPCPPIYTLRMRYPRIIHAELMTHRVFSRNARSSRAVPVKTMLDEVRNDPFVPWHWGKNQKGMQAEEECNERVNVGILPGLSKPWFTTRAEAWIMAAREAADAAKAFSDAGYHKQICNRLLEPFMWIDVLVTSTEWDNFLWLRNHKDAEPHLQDLARLVEAALDGAEFRDLETGEWHLPYVDVEDKRFVAHLRGHAWNTALCKLSAARCARISYKPFDGDASYERELERYDSLVSSDRVHASPLEHQATPDLYFTGKELSQFPPDPGWEHPELHGNLRGWIQYRKTVPGENHTES